MVDQKFENRDNFVINDNYDDQEARELDREDYYDDHSGIFRKKYFSKVPSPFLLSFNALVVLQLVFR